MYDWFVNREFECYYVCMFKSPLLFQSLLLFLADGGSVVTNEVVGSHGLYLAAFCWVMIIATSLTVVYA